MTSETRGPLPDGVVRWLLAASSASVAETATFPLDVTKTRLQLQNELQKAKQGTTTAGMLRTGLNIVQHEGPLELYRGLPAAVLRQAVYGGLGIGLYMPVRRLILGQEDPKTAALWKRIAAGAITGGVGQLVASPTDVVKVRLQADGRLRLQGKQPRYNGTFDAFRKIWHIEGLRGFFKGLAPSVSRAAVINGCGIASYDHSKQFVLKVTGETDSVKARTLGAAVSGLVSACVSSPWDVIKTRLMNQHHGQQHYSGMIDCLVKTVQREGALALYKGFLPAYMRLAPWQFVFFLVFEHLNQVMLGKGM